tara:strand:+ start:34 stop:639 length:606 start_codon:yes stop_codon:yes gene_type:complete
MANVIKNHMVFPTLINEFKFVADENLLKSIQELDIKGVMHSFPKQTENQNLNKLKIFEKLTNKILNTTKEVCEKYEYKYDKIEITNMWLNVSKKDVFFPPHSHSNNIFSGVWYPFEDTSKTPIMFQDPRPACNIMIPYTFNRNPLNSNITQFYPTKDMGLIFPSWLMHYVPSSLGNRISMSWNILLRGEYGNPNDLQNAYI